MNELGGIADKVAENIIDKIGWLFSTAGGWVMAGVIAVINYLGDLKLAFGAVMLSIFMDMLWGIIAAVKKKEFILSYLLRETFVKIAIYGSALFLIMFIEKGINESWFIATKTACAISAACELWSVFANILIVRPNTPFVKLLRKYLAGEIGRKLNLKEEDLLDLDKKKEQDKE